MQINTSICYKHLHDLNAYESQNRLNMLCIQVCVHAISLSINIVARYRGFCLCGICFCKSLRIKNGGACLLIYLFLRIGRKKSQNTSFI